MFSSTLSKPAQESLAVLAKSRIFSRAFMAGGSALALYLGHRESVDFDFFISGEFDANSVIRKLGKAGKYESTTLLEHSIIGQFNGIKISLFNYPYQKIEKGELFLGVELASLEDIAAMKLDAITGRGTKKDYIDLYFLSREKFSFEKMFGYYDRKFIKLEENAFTLVKSMQYFVEADETEMPRMFKKVVWKDIKRYMQGEALRLSKQLDL